MKNFITLILASIGMLTDSGEVAAVCLLFVVFLFLTNKPKN